MTSALLFLLPILVLGGLVFVLFVGRKRRDARGQDTVPAPGSPVSPVFAKPEAVSVVREK